MHIEGGRVSPKHRDDAVRIGLTSVPDDADELRRGHKNLVPNRLPPIVEKDTQSTRNGDLFIQKLLALDQCWHLHVERSIAGIDLKVCVSVYHRDGVNNASVIAPLGIG